MSKRKAGCRVLLTVGLMGSLSSCFWGDEDSTIRLGDNYYILTTTEGDASLYFSDSQAVVTEPLLGEVSSIGTVGKYLAVCHYPHYYLFSLASTTDEAARKTRIGPLAEKAFRLQLYQVTGDSALQLMPVL
ncbi:hypothetical protein GO988_03600 [Hymenobacter sp. HMF4947]|uniref:Lipoprotein n=1 Tax=Hymenobacter ginkgonis TaxID=2682976 RepID=A0A7K1TAI5_9BACT|nr:hypothetical protein [Hymenobacter ginkgonis]MVN75403.1 hypothetical protein [Hymenobacter ginkgonis]